MALPAFTVTCMYTGTPERNQSTPPLGSALIWQEAPSTGVASTNTVPAVNKETGPAIFEVYATADSWLSYGASPSSAASPRIPIPALTTKNFVVAPGDKFMWQAA